MKQEIDALSGLKHKLRMMGVPIVGNSHIYENNNSVVHNTSIKE